MTPACAELSSNQLEQDASETPGERSDMNINTPERLPTLCILKIVSLNGIILTILDSFILLYKSFSYMYMCPTQLQVEEEVRKRHQIPLEAGTADTCEGPYMYCKWSPGNLQELHLLLTNEITLQSLIHY